MKFSILLPTKRPEYLEIVIKSIYDTTKEKENVEILLAIDINDDVSVGLGRQYKEKYNNLYIYIIEPLLKTSEEGRLVPNVVGYYNLLSMNFAKGDFLIPMNDDALFIEPEWDEKAYIKLEDYFKDKEDRIILGITEDFIHHRGYEGIDIPAPMFPLISKEGIEYFGYFFDPKFYGPTADPHIAYQYYNLGKVIDLQNEIKIVHKPKELIKLKRRDR